MLRPTPGDPWGVEQHHWNTGAEENQQLNPGGQGKCNKLVFLFKIAGLGLGLGLELLVPAINSCNSDYLVLQGQQKINK